MRKCPKCGNWTLSFDDYFERFKCLNLDCYWMAPSATEREIRLIREHKEPQLLIETRLDDLNTDLTVWYDDVSDALIFDFGLNELSFEVPENDGQMVWKIAKGTGSVTGFILIGASRDEIGEVGIKIFARRELIEQTLKTIPDVVSKGRPTKILIEKVEVTSHEKAEKVEEQFEKYDFIFAEALKKMKKLNSGLSA